jgi:hypothetical protein
VVDDRDDGGVEVPPQPVVAQGEGRVVELVLEEDVEIGRAQPVPERAVRVVNHPQRIGALRLGEDDDLVAPAFEVLHELAVVEVPARHPVQVPVNDKADAH